MSSAVPVAHPLTEVAVELRERPGLFDFFQAVRIMLRMAEDKEVVGGFAKPQNEVVRFSAHNSLAFPPSAIDSIDWDSPIPRMVVNFMGLTGPQGVLPYCYSEMIVDRLRNRDRSTAAFFDIFNHRMISLFYQAWEKHRSAVAYERDGEDRLSRYLMCLMGIGTGGLQHRLVVRDESLLYYTGLLSLQPKSAAALRQILEDYFGITADVEQFVGAWQSLDPSNQCVFEDGLSFSEQLGIGVVVGDEIWDQQSRIRLMLGPLTVEQYLGFLPGGAAFDPLRDLVRLFCGADLEIEVQLILARGEVPRCEMGKDDIAGPRLGWFTWMKSGMGFDRAPSDTVFLLG
jgi:type VI secretion system protein ImpH